VFFTIVLKKEITGVPGEAALKRHVWF